MPSADIRPPAGRVCTTFVSPLLLLPLNGFKLKLLDIEDYNKIYQQQLDKLDPQKVWSDLHALTNGSEPTLLCFEKPKAQLASAGSEPHPSDPNLWFCHRRLVADWLQSNLNQKVPETLKEKPGLKHLGFIRSGLNDLKSWCRTQQPTEQPTASSYARGRFEKWFEHEFKLTMPVEVIPAEL